MFILDELFSYESRMKIKTRYYLTKMTKHGAKTLFYAQMVNFALSRLEAVDKEIILEEFRDNMESFSGFVDNTQLSELNGLEGLDEDD